MRGLLAVAGKLGELMAYQAPEKVIIIRGKEYKGLNISGKAYAPVPSRVEAAHDSDGYTMIRCEYKEIFDLKCCEVEIEVKGQRFIGTAEVKMSFGNPISDAQTSAVGRALAFAGFGVETAIASAEDMEAVMRDKGGRVVEAEPAALPEPRLTLQGERPILEYIRRANAAGLAGKPMMDKFIEWTGESWNVLNQHPTDDDLEALAEGLTEYLATP